MHIPALRRRARPAYLGFAVFGAFWGTWGASIPALRDRAGIGDGELGTALLCVGAGALPAMLVSGRLIDRWGHRAGAAFVLSLGAAGMLVASTARDLLSLSLGLLVLGAASGATDVAINAAAGSAQQADHVPVVSRAHGLFSASVVLSSLSAGGLRALGAPLALPFALVAVLAAVAALELTRSGPPGTTEVPEVDRPAPARHRPDAGAPGFAALVVIGALGALAFAVENGHQSWSALYLGDVLEAGPALASTGPAVFAATVAVVRFSTATVGSRHPRAVITTGALVAAVGTTIVGLATSALTGLVGLALAAAGTAVLYPTLLSALTVHLPEHARGRATAIVTTVAYLGFLAGPVYVGRWAAAAGLPEAMLALGALSALLAATNHLALRAALPTPEPRAPGTAPGPVEAAAGWTRPSRSLGRPRDQ